MTSAGGSGPTWVAVDHGLDPGARAEAEGLLLDWFRSNHGWADVARLHSVLEGKIDAATLGRLLDSLVAVGRLEKQTKTRWNGDRVTEYRLRETSMAPSPWVWLLIGGFVVAVIAGAIIASNNNQSAAQPTSAAPSSQQSQAAITATTAPVANNPPTAAPTAAVLPSSTANAAAGCTVGPADGSHNVRITATDNGTCQQLLESGWAAGVDSSGATQVCQLDRQGGGTVTVTDTGGQYYGHMACEQLNQGKLPSWPMTQ